jgi:ribonuclease HII
LKIIVAGIDEVGRGALAGPVIAAAVILKNNISGLNDSKKLSPKKRSYFSDLIKDNSSYAFGSASNYEIDNINILNASLLAMKRAILNLSVKPDLVLVDGIHKPDLDIKMEAIIGGDALKTEISAASIIAKVYRDNLMVEYDKSFPNYGFEKHKGYGTKEHLDSIKINGICSIHRRSFNGVK